MPGSFLVGKVPIHNITVPDACSRISEAIAAGETGYVCVSNMRTVVAANRDAAYLDVMEHSLLNVPDGTPLTPGDTAFTVTLTVENDGIQLAAKSVQLLVTVSEVTEETPEGPVTSREVTLRLVEYLDDPAA